MQLLDPPAAANLIDTDLGVSEWTLVDQARIDAFAEVTGDRQFIHVDPVAAAATPFGAALIVQSARGIAFLAFADDTGHFDGFDDCRAPWREAAWERDDAAARRVAATIWRSTPIATSTGMANERPW
jgi:hypothetical protein